MPATHFALCSRRIVTPNGVRDGAVVVAGHKIEALVDADQVPGDIPRTEFGDLAISPGIVDSHVHVNEPGRTEWEGFKTATQAAAAGGVTTLIDMPLNSTPVTTTIEALAQKQSSAADKCWVDVAFYGGLVPGNAAHLESLIDAGVCGIKCFLCDTGLDDFQPVDRHILERAMPILARRNVPLLVHAELINEHGRAPHDLYSYTDWLASRPEKYECDAAELLGKLSVRHGAHVHIVHITNFETARLLEAANRAGARLSGETCPHYLHFCAEQLTSADPRWKCAPPIRDAHQRESLWKLLADGTLATIGSDHSPCPPELKYLEECDFQRAWGGIASLELTLPVVWTGARQRGICLEMLSHWLSAAPARLAGIDDRKGEITAGLDADLCVWDPNRQWTVAQDQLHQRHKVSPYDGERLVGQVIRTYVRGQLVYDGGSYAGDPVGRLLARGTTGSG